MVPMGPSLLQRGMKLRALGRREDAVDPRAELLRVGFSRRRVGGGVGLTLLLRLREDGGQLRLLGGVQVELAQRRAQRAAVMMMMMMRRCAGRRSDGRAGRLRERSGRNGESYRKRSGGQETSAEQGDLFCVRMTRT